MRSTRSTSPKSGKRTHRGPPALSAEIFLIPLEDRKFIVYAPLRQSAFIGNEYVADCIRRLQKGEWYSNRRDVTLVKLLRGLDMVDAGPESRPSRLFPSNPAPTSVTLFLTTACNLRCSYCYASAGNRRPRSMSLSTAQRGIDFAAQNAAATPCRTLGVSYHGGGEPTVNWLVLSGSADYARSRARELGLTLQITLTTNGILSEEQRAWVRANVTSLTISCDGLPAIHDRHRIDAKGRPSSARVFETLSYLDKSGGRYGIRATVTADAFELLPDSVDFLTSQFRAEGIQVEPVYLLGRALEARTAESDGFVDAFRRARDRAAANGRRLWFSGARVGTLTNHFCSATQDNFCLSAAGNVTSCYEAFSEDVSHVKVFYYGRPSNGASGYDFDLKVLDHLRAQAVENRRFCSDCFAKWTCGGDCYYKWRAGSHSSEFDGSPRCHIIRELTKDQIIEKISEAGGTFWHGSQSSKGHPHFCIAFQ
jgi:uncharacterized protein